MLLTLKTVQNTLGLSNTPGTRGEILIDVVKNLIAIPFSVSVRNKIGTFAHEENVESCVSTSKLVHLISMSKESASNWGSDIVCKLTSPQDSRLTCRFTVTDMNVRADTSHRSHGIFVFDPATVRWFYEDSNHTDINTDISEFVTRANTRGYHSSLSHYKQSLDELVVFEVELVSKVSPSVVDNKEDPGHNLESHGDVEFPDGVTDGDILRYNSTTGKWSADVEKIETAASLNEAADGNVYSHKDGDEFKFRGISAGANVAVTQDGSTVTVSAADQTWDQVTGKPITFPPNSHTHRLDGLDDVDTSQTANGSVLSYNNEFFKWTAKTLPEQVYETGVSLNEAADGNVYSHKDGDEFKFRAISAGANIAVTQDATTVTISTIPGPIEDAANVTVTDPNHGDILRFDTNTVEWVNAPLPENAIGTATDYANNGEGTAGLAVLSLNADGTTWSPKDITIDKVYDLQTQLDSKANSNALDHTLTSHIDVETSMPQHEDVLTYNSATSQWENKVSKQTIVENVGVSGAGIFRGRDPGTDAVQLMNITGVDGRIIIDNQPTDGIIKIDVNDYAIIPAVHDLSSHSDIFLNYPYAGQIIQHDGNRWINTDPPTQAIVTASGSGNSGLSIYAQKVGNDLQFKNIDVETAEGLTLSDVDNTLKIGANLNLDHLTDTTITGPSNNQVLTFDSTTSQWVNKELPGPSSIENHANYNPNNEVPVYGGFLARNSATNEWGPKRVTISDIENLDNDLAGKAPVSHSHLKSEISDFAHTHGINEITNLQTTLDSKASAVHDLQSHSDVQLTTVADTQLLIYDGATSHWKNKNLNLEELHNIAGAPINHETDPIVLPFTRRFEIQPNVLAKSGTNVLLGPNCTTVQNNLTANSTIKTTANNRRFLDMPHGDVLKFSAPNQTSGAFTVVMLLGDLQYQAPSSGFSSVFAFGSSGNSYSFAHRYDATSNTGIVITSTGDSPSANATVNFSSYTSEVFKPIFIDIDFTNNVWRTYDVDNPTGGTLQAIGGTIYDVGYWVFSGRMDAAAVPVPSRGAKRQFMYMGAFDNLLNASERGQVADILNTYVNIGGSGVSVSDKSFLRYNVSNSKWEAMQILGTASRVTVVHDTVNDSLKIDTVDAPAHSIGSHSDTVITTPANLNALVYDTATGKWINRVQRLDNGALADVTLTSQLIGNTLHYNGSSWVNRARSYYQLSFVDTVNNFFIPTVSLDIPVRVAVPINASTTLISKGSWSNPSAGVIQYTGSTTWMGKIMAEVTGGFSTNGREMGYTLARGTTLISDTDIRANSGDSSGARSRFIFGELIQINPNDQFSLYVTLRSGGNTSYFATKLKIFIELIERIV